MSLIIITKTPSISFFSSETYKRVLRKITKRNRGPSGVTASLVRGLNTLKADYKINPKIEDIHESDTIWVNESLDALKWVVTFKKDGQKLIVGPNLVVTALDENEIISNKKIDVILQPSEWTRKFMASVKPELLAKIKLWPAGVELVPIKNINKTIDALIYCKNDMGYFTAETIIPWLTQHSLSYEILHYGRFNQENYFDALEKTKLLIYLSHSESQGLAVQEAWARDIPTLVYNRGYFEYGTYHFEDEKISSPYLTSQTGMFFTKENFGSVFTEFNQLLITFAPRLYVETHLSDEVCARNFLTITGLDENDTISL